VALPICFFCFCFLFLASTLDSDSGFRFLVLSLGSLLAVFAGLWWTDL